MRKLTPGGYEYLTGSVACADRDLEAGESLTDYYVTSGYPPGEWFGSGAADLGVSGQVAPEQMNALFGEGRHPDADEIEAGKIAAGASPEQAQRATKLGRRFPQYGGTDELRSRVLAAYKQHNRDRDWPVNAAIDADTRAGLRQQALRQAFTDTHERAPADDGELNGWLQHKNNQTKNAVAGYELVLAPPKSVSIAWALADDHTRDHIVGMHRQAVRDTLTHLENNAAFTRQGDTGEAQVDVRGITATLFEHWDSRAGDPHLHTHVPISNKVQRISDGKWTSLDGRTMHAATVTMSEFYDSRLRDLFRDHGAHWTQRPRDGIDMKRPVWELDGVSNDLLRSFSQRTQQVEADRADRIVAFRNEHGREPAPKELFELKRQAQFDSRSGKQPPKTLREHVQEWSTFAETVVPREQITDLAERVFSPVGEPLSPIDVDSLANQVRRTVSDHHAHFTRWNIEAEAHRQTAGLRMTTDAREAVVGAVADAALNAGDTVALRVPALVAEPAVLRRSSGESVFVEHNAQRYTTQQTLREEAALVEAVHQGGGHRARPATVDAAIRQHTHLNEGQRNLVANFALSGRRMQLALAPAGSGKTTAMRVFADAWRTDGGRVYAFGPSARAAQELGGAIDATPHTLHQVTTAQRKGTVEDRFDFTRGDVLVIDEAAMAGTHTLHDVVDYALDRGADVRLVGDDKQLAAVEAGGAVTLIAHDAGAVRLSEVVRFTDPDQARASKQIRQGNPNGLDYYNGRELIHSGSRETMRDAAQQAWRADLDSGRETLLIVPTNDDVVALNRQARAQRIQHGSIDTQRQVALHDGTHASRGDWIVTRNNDRTKGVFGGKDFVKNGDTWHVQSVTSDGTFKVTHRAHGGATILPADYVAEHVELAYAATANRVQGMTAEDSAHTLVPKEMTHEQFYPSITRARDANRMYVVTHHHVADAHQETPPEQTAEAVLFGVLNHRGAETSATEELRAALGHEESLATQIDRYAYAAYLGSDVRYERLLTENMPVELEESPTELLVTLRTAEDHGWQAERLLPQVTSHSLAEVDNPAVVLQWRINQHLTDHEPPARVIDPELSAINRWRSLVEDVAPQAAVENDAWQLVWRHAAAGAADGLDADTAVSISAQQLSSRPASDPMDEHRYVAQVVVDQLDEQRDEGMGWSNALPFMARPHESVLAGDSDLARYLRETNTAIRDRAAELGLAVAEQQPEWASNLGPRPEQASAAEQWDRLATLAAAYRETYGITSNDPTTPLGEEPDGNSVQTQAWRTITNQWGPPVTTPDDEAPRSDLDERIATLRAEVHSQHGTGEDQARSSARRTDDDRDPFGDEDDLNLRGGYGTSNGMGSGL